MDGRREAGDARGASRAEAKKVNLALWNEWTTVHVASDFYDVAGFRAGNTVLHPLEVEELGDVAGKSLLHLQCHFGLDTLSWARLGATVTGVDFSDRAIATARALADEVGLQDRASFVECDVDDLPGPLAARAGSFDVVFTSYGAIEWLPDLRPWGRVIAAFLNPGGTFYMAEIHPFARTLELNPDRTDVCVAYPYSDDRPERSEVIGSYADPGARVTQQYCYGWSHSFADIVGSLLAAGLRIEYLHEFPFSVCPFWDLHEKRADGWYWLRTPDGTGFRREVPFTFSLKATKPEDE